MPTPQGFVVDIGEEAIGGSVGALAGSRYEIVERTDEHLLVKIVRSNGGETTYDVRLENETMLVRIAQATNEKIEMTFERE